MKPLAASTFASPMKRYFARMLDQALFSTVMVIVILEVISFAGISRQMLLESRFLIYLTPVVLMLSAMLMEVLWYSVLGATPGKRLFCLRVVDLQGNALTRLGYAKRLCWVGTTGMGMDIPYVAIVPMLFQWHRLSKGGATTYDKDRYRVDEYEMSTVRQCAAAVFMAYLVLGTLYALFMQLTGGVGM